MRILNRSTRVALNSVAIGVIALIAFGTARADTISTQTESVPATYTNWSNIYSFNQFNPALGTLQSVTVSSQGFLNDLGVTFTNTDGQTETVTSFQETFQVGLTGPGTLSQTSSGSLPAIPSFILNSGATSTYTGSPPTINGNVASNTFTSSLGAYEGSGNVTFTGTGVAYDTFAGGSNIKVDPVAEASQTVTLTYDYIPTPSPEPFSMSLSGIGLVLLSVIGRKRLVRNR
jgi:hypothetical protein